jgi:hypothetical protein
MSDDKIAKRRILPKPRPLMPDEDRADQAIMRRFNPASAMPMIDENDPEVLEAQRQAREAEERLRALITKKTILKLQEAGQALDPDKVEELCKKERWKAGELTDLSKEYFGFVPEKFEMLAKSHPEDSPEHQKYMEACMQARKIYWDQIKADVRKATAPLNKPDITPIKRRAGHEDISTQLWHFYKRAGLENDPIYKYQGARILWAAEAGIRESFEKGGKTTTGRGNGYRKEKIQLILPDEMRGEATPTADPPAATPD